MAPPQFIEKLFAGERCRPEKIWGLMERIWPRNTQRVSGYSIPEKSFRNRLGEIDIVAKYQDHLVICGVKSRSSGKIDSSLSVTLAERTKFRKLYEVSITRHPNKLRMHPRFDVTSIIFKKTMLQS